MPESRFENLHIQEENEKSKLDKYLRTLKIKLFNVQCLGLKYYMSSPSFEIISIPILLFKLLSYSFHDLLILIFYFYCFIIFLY